MGWKDLIGGKNDQRILPWVGGRMVYDSNRFWKLEGPLPLEFGWCTFAINGGKTATFVGPAEPDQEFIDRHKKTQGYLVDNRFIWDKAQVFPDPKWLLSQTRIVHLIEPGLPRFCRATVIGVGEDQGDKELIFIRQEFPQGSEEAVLLAYQDRKDSVRDIPGVTPALDLAFRWMTYQRADAERREKERLQRVEEEARKQEAKEKLQQALAKAGTGAGRRELAAQDFNAAAKAALSLTGSELLDARPGYNRNEMVVDYRFRHRRLQCVVNKATLQVVDAGICLTDHHTGEKGDTYFTLESLPAVVGRILDDNPALLYIRRGNDMGRNEYWGDEDDEEVD